MGRGKEARESEKNINILFYLQLFLAFHIGTLISLPFSLLWLTNSELNW